MSGDTSYGGPQHAPWLTIAVLVAIYVLMVLTMWWGRHHRDDIERQHQVKQAQLMREIRQYDSDMHNGVWDEAD